jgi:rubrerythrin
MTIIGIDFAKLTLMDALDLAILIEDEARERYEEFAHQMDRTHTPETAKFFRYMVENETKHGQEITKRRTELFGSAPATVSPDLLFDVEAPDYDATRAFMSARQAMQAALSSEYKAHRFFEAAQAAVKDDAVRILFQDLRDEELTHQAMVEAEIAKLGPDDPGTLEDYPDDLAPQ